MIKHEHKGGTHPGASFFKQLPAVVIWLMPLLIVGCISIIKIGVPVDNDDITIKHLKHKEEQEMAINVPYVTIPEADAINTSPEWIAASSDQKDHALQMGRIYIDANYSCTIDESDPGDAVKYANAVFGDYSLRGILFPAAGSRGSDKVTIEEKVKAGSVESSEKYATKSDGSIKEVDPFIDISAVLKTAGCSYTPLEDTGAGIASIVRAR
jgi:hypothetical protein